MALVIIGILVALNINNWNEARKRTLEEIQMLTEFKASLQKDLEDPIQSTLDRILYDSTRVESILGILKNYNTGDDPILPPGSGLAVITHEIQFEPQTSAYKTLESQGINLISSRKIRNSLLDIYNNAYPSIKNKIANKMINIRDYGRPIMRSKFKTLANGGFEILDHEVYQDPIFWNTLLTAQHNNEEITELLTEVKEKVVHLVDELETEIVRLS